MGKKFKLLLLTLGALTLFSACSSVYTDTEMKANKEVGKWKYYDENGNLLGEAPYDQIPKAIRDAKEKNIDQFWKDIKAGK